MSNFTSIEELRAQAESIGLKGDDVGRFVLNQQAFERDERTKEHIRLFIKEQSVTSLESAVVKADDWASAHKAYPKPNTNYASGKTSFPRRKSNVVESLPPPSHGSTHQDTKGGAFRTPMRCFNCGEEGHHRSRCPKNPRAFKDKEAQSQFKVGFYMSNRTTPYFTVAGTINGSWTSTIVRDTGCNYVLVSEEAVLDADVSLCPKVSVADFLGRVNEFPVVRCYIRSPYYEVWVDAVRAPMKCASVLIGNVPGARDPSKPDPFPFKPHASSLDTTTHSTLPIGMQTSIAAAAPITKMVPPPTLTQESTFQINAVETRRSKMKRVHPLQMPALQPLSVTPEEFCSQKESCPTLAGLWDQTKSEKMDQTKNGSSFQYLKIDGLLYRKCVLSTHVEKVDKLALVVPKECRPIILSVGHENPLAGHFSQRKTALKIADKFFWPGMAVDICDFCRSCDICQRMSSKGRVRPVPLHPLPIITEPFSRVPIDLVGPLSPPFAEGHRYILTLIDFATDFPEAVPLKEVDSISVAESLLTIFSRVGIPRETLSDQGTQFTSQLMAELHKLLGVKPSFTTPFHPSGNGRVERLHGPLKAALRKMCSEKHRDWHRYLFPTLFALREIPSDRTGLSAFELLYGRTVRGPLSVLRDLWEDRSIKDDDRSTFSYVIELKDKLAESAKIAAQNADGPYEVLEKRGKVDYVIDSPTGPKLYHANLLKKYYRRPSVSFAELLDEPSTIDDSPLHKEICFSEPEDSRLPVTPDGQTDETDSRPNVNPKLEGYQQTSLEELVSEFKEVFSDNPGCTSSVEHDIILTTTDRIHMKVYPVPVHLKPHFESEVERLFQQGIIQRSSSPHCSPVPSSILASYWVGIVYSFNQTRWKLCVAYHPSSTKKLLRSFLGMVGFYKMFIPQAADYTGPLSNLLRKTVREPLPWTEELLFLFNHLRLVLSSNPVIRLPDTSLTFVLRTDASNHGLGAVLLLYHLDYPHPVAFASRKLLDRESRYSTIEREYLVVVFGIQRFYYYLRGREFVSKSITNPSPSFTRSRATGEAFSVRVSPTTILTAELVAIREALGKILTLPRKPPRVTILSDSQAAHLGVHLQYQWVSSHVGHHGNERAESTARHGALSPEEDMMPLQPSLSDAYCKIDQAAWYSWKSEYTTTAASRG
ncbi:uncharacterized protein LOC143038314 [Oratosquilla oratoria]|uniref:uncharacterized protein LOC143038314 n=1 Tax=Oratosquilla oratoria TaxID=337810 RepID=UPI003F774080